MKTEIDLTGDDNEDSAQDDVKDEEESEVKVLVLDNMANPKVYDNNHEHNLPNSYVTSVDQTIDEAVQQQTLQPVDPSTQAHNQGYIQNTMYTSIPNQPREIMPIMGAMQPMATQYCQPILNPFVTPIMRNEPTTVIQDPQTGALIQVSQPATMMPPPPTQPRTVVTTTGMDSTTSDVQIYQNAKPELPTHQQQQQQQQQQLQQQYSLSQAAVSRISYFLL